MDKINSKITNGFYILYVGIEFPCLNKNTANPAIMDINPYINIWPIGCLYSKHPYIKILHK